MELKELKRLMPKIFEAVKNDVKRVYGRHRAGLSLGLVEMGIHGGGFIGGMHFHPGHNIVMNKTPLKIILDSQPYEIVWSYTCHILLHEYIHSLGFINEQQCRSITLKVSEQVFSDVKHPAIVLAKNGIGTYIPNLKLIYLPPERRPEGLEIEYVHGFDKESQTYFS